jgi:inner membrane protein
VAALALSALWRRSRWPATIGLAVLAGYVAFQGALHQRALELGREFAALNGSNAATVSAYPRPVSPFNWMVVVSEPERYRYAFVNLIRKEVPPTPGADAGFITRLDAAYLPRSLLKWTIRERAGTSADERALIAQAWEQPALAFYRWFSALPVTYRIERGNPSTCVWFEDLRFLTPGRDAMPFRFGACREGDSGAWEAFQLTDAGARVRAR